jgi:hypothetical protein
MKTPTLISLVALVVLTSSPLVSQVKKEEPTMGKVLPANWGKLGLTDPQKQQVYKIQDDYYGKILALEKQLKELRMKRTQDLEAVLSDDQKAKLKAINLQKAGADDKKDEKK